VFSIAGLAAFALTCYSWVERRVEVLAVPHSADIRRWMAGVAVCSLPCACVLLAVHVALVTVSNTCVVFVVHCVTFGFAACLRGGGRKTAE
jgi:hypothetical protein